MKTGLRAVWQVIRTALYGWFLALVTMIRRLLAVKRRARADDRDEHERNASPSRCVPIDDPAHVRPDPLVYSQKYLRERGLNVTWQNPDFFMRRGGVDVDSHQLEPGTSYEVTVRVWNASVDGPVVDMPVHLSFLSFGAGTQTHPIDTKRIDVGVKGGADEPAFVTFEWTTPPEAGHYCLQALLDPVDDAEYGNNLGQHNTNVVETQSPGVFSFELGNDTPRRHEYHFVVDTYELPDSRPCKHPDKGTEARRDHPVDRVHLDEHRLPAGWSIDIEPDHPSIAPGDQEQILVTVTPPDEFTGPGAEQVINVHALYREYYEDRVAGGVTVKIRTGG